MDLQAETARVLGELIRFNTVNPPGNERPAQEWLEAYLTDAGFECTMLGAETDRPNLIARLRGREPGPVLGYLSHVDTVLAEPSEWTHSPWSGEEIDGFVWGRGAIDMKSQTAAEVVAAASLARGGWRPARGDLLVLSVVDEEVGGWLGARWLCEHHRDEVRCDYLVNEGGGSLFPFEGRDLYGVCCAEKGVFRFTLATRGTAGHASMPRMGDNALLKLAPLLDRLGSAGATHDVTEQAAALLTALGLDPADPAAAVARVEAADPRLAIMVEPMLGVTFAPTRARASEKINVIPSRAEVKVDCRTPPGAGEELVRRRLEAVLDGVDYELSFDEQVVGNGSEVESPLMDAIRGWAGSRHPEAEVVPTMLPAYTDSTAFRDAFPDCVAYGFFPQRHMTLYETAPLLHAPDERIDVRDLGHAADFFAYLAPELLG